MKISDLLRARRYDEALAACEELLAKEPDNAKAWAWKGIALRNTDRPAEACECYEKALALDPDSAANWLNRGMSIRFMNRKNTHELAVEAYQNAIRLDPGCVDAMMNLGNVTSRAALAACDIREADELYAKSYDAYLKALQLNPNSWELHCNMAVLYHKQKRLEQALVEADAALVLNGDYQDGWFTKGSLLADARRYGEAEEALRKAVALDPGSITAIKAYINLGIVLFSQDRCDEAADAFLAAEKIELPFFFPLLPLLRADATYNLALALRRMGRQEEFETVFARHLDYYAKGELFYDWRKQDTSPAAAVNEHIED